MAYNDKVLDHYENPRNVGSMDKEDPAVGTGMVGAPACFVGGTLISTPENNGSITLKDMFDQNNIIHVWSYNIKDNKYELKKAKAVKTGIKQVVELSIDDGGVIRCTADHQFLTYDNSYKECSNLKNVSLRAFNKTINNSGYWDINRQQTEHIHYIKVANGKLTNSIWKSYAKTFGKLVPSKVEHRFGKFSTFSEAAAINFNHKIINIDQAGIEEVYCLQVEENNNFVVLTKQTMNRHSGIVVKNCGDVMRLQIKVTDGIIEDAKFKTYGCGSAIASSSLMTEMLKGMSLEDAGEIKNSRIVEELSLPPVKIHCSVLAEDAIKAAIQDYKNKQNGADIVGIYTPPA